MTYENAQLILHMNIRLALVVMLICLFPHMSNLPWWIFVVVFAAMAYRFIADYYGLPELHSGIRAVVVLFNLFLLHEYYGNIFSGGFFIGFLLTFVALKTIEVHESRDLKVLIICNFYLIFTSLIVHQDTWIIAYMFFAIFANLALLVSINAPGASFRLIGRKSSVVIFIAIPLSITVFYLFPRIDQPLWRVPSLKSTPIGFGEKMNPGSITELSSDSSIAMRVTFKDKPIKNGYWRGINLSYYYDETWSPGLYQTRYFTPLKTFTDNEQPDYEVILEPTQKKWLFYMGTPGSTKPQLYFDPATGLANERIENINQRYAYSIKVKESNYQELNPKEIAINTQLPPQSNPKLRAWAKEEFIKSNQDPQAFILFLAKYIRHQPYWYSLAPPPINNKSNQMDSFWFDTQKGFCEHYASAVAIILRSAGIPARVILGYQGGTWNPIGRYLILQQNNAHAWVEYWHAGVGWQQFDPTSFIAQERIDPAVRELQPYTNTLDENESGYKLTWLNDIKFTLQSLQFFGEKWVLFYNQNTQQQLLKKLGLEQLDFTSLIQSSIGSTILFILLMSIGYHWWQKRQYDPLLREYQFLQKELKQLKIAILPSYTLQQQCMALIQTNPNLATTVTLFLYQYEKLRLKESNLSVKDNKKATIKLIKKFRKKIKNNSLSHSG